MNEFLLGLPLWTAKVGAVLLLGGILLFVWLLPRNYVYESGRRLPLRQDLRLWATLLLCVQVLLYWIF